MLAGDVKARRPGLGARWSDSLLWFVLTVVTGLSLTALLFAHFVNVDRAKVRVQLQRGVETLVSFAAQPVMDPTIAQLTGKMTGVQAAIYSGAALSQDTLADWLWQPPAPPGFENTSIEYLPRVNSANVASFASMLQGQENAGFPIMELRKGKRVPVPPRSDYYPILLEAAPGSAHGVIGLDRSNDPFIWLAMQQARDSGMIAFYTSYPLAQFDEHELVTHFFLALYDTAATPATLAERRAHHNGFIAFSSYAPAQQLMPYLLESIQGLDLAYFPQVLDLATDPDYAPIQALLDEGAAFTMQYQAVGMEFGVVGRASAALVAALASPTRWWVLSFGLLITTWMSSLVLWQRTRSRKIMALVAERTRDLAERTSALSQANAALQQSESRYRMLADNASDVIYTCNLDGNCTYISPSVKQQRGFDAAELTGKAVSVYMPAESVRIIQVRLDIARKALANNPAGIPECPDNKFELETYCKDGSLRWFETTVSILVDAAGKPNGFIGVSRDVTERKVAEYERVALEEAYRQAQKMEAIGTLAGGIAHDFNNLLTGIFGYAELLRLQVQGNSAAEESIGVIEKAASRAREVTSKLLGFARRGRFQAVPVDLNDTVMEVITLLKSAVDKKIDISARLHATEAVVTGDPGQLSHLFLNLGINARDAMPQGGKLVFACDLVEVDDAFCRTHPGLVPGIYNRVQVSDTGIGIDKERLPRIFEPFFTDKEQGKGTGLGLAMVYGVATSHGGIVVVDSVPGQGSTFAVYLPCSAGQPRKVPVEKSARVARGAGTIMVVDDEPLIRNLAENLLKSMGYKVVLAEDGARAQHLYRNQWRDIDLVIVDMIMPTMGGSECIAALRAINPDVKVILVTGYSREAIADKLDKTEIISFLPKPFGKHQLSQHVAEALQVA